jgi:hypothetical protein
VPNPNLTIHNFFVAVGGPPPPTADALLRALAAPLAAAFFPQHARRVFGQLLVLLQTMVRASPRLPPWGARALESLSCLGAGFVRRPARGLSNRRLSPPGPLARALL